jgi:hypothetical protein
VKRTVVVASVNGGPFLPTCSRSKLRVVNLDRLQSGDYDEIFLASDLMITDNCISNSLGKAVCGLVPSVTLRNSFRLPDIVERAHPELRNIALEMDLERAGSVFSFEVFPIWTDDDIRTLGLFTENPIEECISMLEMFGDSQIEDKFEQLLEGLTHREEVRARQQTYLSMIGKLPTGEEALLAMME